MVSIVDSQSVTLKDKPVQKLQQAAERMLACAEHRSRQALKLAVKWKARLADLDRKGTTANQTKLWADDLGTMK